MTAAYLALLGLVGLERLVELRISRRNQLKLERLGVRKITEPHFRWMVFVHAGVLACAAAEVLLLHRPLIPSLAIAMAALFVFTNALRMVGNPDPGGTLERGSDGVFSRRRRDVRSVPVGPASELRCRGDRVVFLANDTHGLAHGTGRDTREPGDPAAKAACRRRRPDG